MRPKPRVFLVVRIYYDEQYVVGVYREKDKAEACIKECRKSDRIMFGYEIEEHEVR